MSSFPRTFRDTGSIISSFRLTLSLFIAFPSKNNLSLTLIFPLNNYPISPPAPHFTNERQMLNKYVWIIWGKRTLFPYCFISYVFLIPLQANETTQPTPLLKLVSRRGQELSNLKNP